MLYPRVDIKDDIERKTVAILRVLEEAQSALGAKAIAERLRELGIHITERTVRYHLQLMDARGLTQLVGRKDGRQITDKGRQELREARVKDKVGLVLSRIEELAYRTTFNPKQKKGLVPVNFSLIPSHAIEQACELMAPAFEAGLCVSPRIKLFREGKGIGAFVVPQGQVGLATVCSIVINGVLLKAGVPINSKFAGILQFKQGKAYRFVELIYYAGTSLDPSEAFIRADMTSVSQAARTGDGKLLANFRELSAVCREATEETIALLAQADIKGVALIGEVGEDVCGVPVELGRIGMVLLGGLNPVCCLKEAGIDVVNFAMSEMLDYRELEPFEKAFRSFR